MEPAFHQGQEVLVNKTIFGARLYKSLDFSDKKLKSCRMPGKRNIRVGDVVVFNYPYPYSNDTIAFKMNYVYVKRCYGSPGDSVRIKDGYYLLSGNKIGPKDFQSILSSTSDSILRSMGVVLSSLQVNRTCGWTIKNFGPLYVPAKGDEICINSSNFRIYRRLIQFETGSFPVLSTDKRSVILNGSFLYRYRFKSNWYFLGGDNVMNSRDSRYIGLVPEEYIIGVVSTPL